MPTYNLISSGSDFYVDKGTGTPILYAKAAVTRKDFEKTGFVRLHISQENKAPVVLEYPLADFQVSGADVSDVADAVTKLAAVFPNVGGVTPTPGLEDVAFIDNQTAIRLKYINKDLPISWESSDAGVHRFNSPKSYVLYLLQGLIYQIFVGKTAAGTAKISGLVQNPDGVDLYEVDLNDGIDIEDVDTIQTYVVYDNNTLTPVSKVQEMIDVPIEIPFAANNTDALGAGLEEPNLYYVSDGSVKAVINEPLQIEWDDIENVPVADAASVDDWNTFFNMPSNATRNFTFVTIVGNIVKLFGAKELTLPANIFNLNTHLISILDPSKVITQINAASFGFCSNAIQFDLPGVIQANGNSFSGCSSLATINFPELLTVGNACFQGCPSLGEINFPKATSVGNYAFFGDVGCEVFLLPLATSIGTHCFENCTAAIQIDLSAVTDLGGSLDGDNVFTGISGNSIELQVPPAIKSVNLGDPDGDIVILQANNTVTVNP